MAFEVISSGRDRCGRGGWEGLGRGRVIPRAVSTRGWSFREGTGGLAEGRGGMEESVGWATRPVGLWMTVDRFGIRAVVEESLRSRLTDFMRLMSVESR